MKVIFLFLLLIYQTNIITCEEENKDLKFNPDEILILNDNTYEKEIKDNENILILAYAPWCHYCKSFEQIYLLLNKKVKEENLNYKISVIDATENTKFSNEYDIKSYPTLVFIIKNGNETFIYNSERTIDSILRFMHKKVYNSFYELKTNEEVNKFYSEKKVLLLSTYPKETKENEIFIELSKLNNDLEYIICNSEDCINKYNKDIILLKNYDEEIIKLSEIEFLKSKEFSINLLNKLLGSFLYKLGDMFNDKYIDYIFNNNKSSIFYVRNSKNEKETINDKIIIELGKELREKYAFFTLDTEGENKEFFERTNEFFSLSNSERPLIIYMKIITEENTPIYKMEKKEITKETILTFINECNENKILPILDSENIPEENSETNLKLIVGKNFDKEIIENDKNVLLFCLKENCKKCDLVGDIAENLSENYKDNNELKFTVINIEKNKIRYVNEEDYKKIPSIFLFLKNQKKEPIKYNGKFDIKKLSKWMAVKIGWQEWDESVDEVYDNDKDDDDNNDYKKKYPFLNEDL